jgi:hypothetical protein
MKPFFQTAVLLLVAASLLTCNDLALEPAESLDQQDLQQTKSQVARQAFTFTAVVTSENEPYNQFLAYMQGSRGSINVNWGDGSSTTYPLGDGQFELVKIYSAPGQYPVIITGDLKNITQFKSSYGQGVFTDINLRPLTGLRSLRMSNMAGPEILDLSRAKNLADLTPTDITNLKEIYLPKQHSLWAVSISGDTSLTSATVDAMINSVYETAIKKDIWGFFHLLKYPYDENGSTEMVGPPSETSIRQLTELQNVYGWEILPEMPRPAQ